MKRILPYLGVLLFAASLSPASVSAQAPNISYTPGTSALLVGVPFSISPANTGGAVPATTYGQVTTLVGSTTGASGYTDATGTAARFNFPQNIVGDASGNLYLGDYNNNVIRKISALGGVTTFAGSTWGRSGNDGRLAVLRRFPRARNKPHPFVRNPAQNHRQKRAACWGAWVRD